MNEWMDERMERMNDACDPVLDFEYFFSSLRSGPLLAISAIYQDYAWRLESEKKIAIKSYNEPLNVVHNRPFHNFSSRSLHGFEINWTDLEHDAISKWNLNVYKHSYTCLALPAIITAENWRLSSQNETKTKRQDLKRKMLRSKQRKDFWMKRLRTRAHTHRHIRNHYI